MLRLALLISGGGTTMLEIIRACAEGSLKGLVEPVLVIASKDGIRGIERARTAGIPEGLIRVVDPNIFASREMFGQALLEILQAEGIDLIGQYGWLPLTPECVVEAYPGTIINQHPGPLDNGRPDFGGPGMYGRRVHCARLWYARMCGDPSELFTEATTHYVTPEFDKGHVIGRSRVEILPGDDVISLQERVLPEEHELQIEVLGDLGRGTVRPYFRDEPLVSNQHLKLLEESKRIAITLFPHG